MRSCFSCSIFFLKFRITFSMKVFVNHDLFVKMFVHRFHAQTYACLVNETQCLFYASLYFVKPFTLHPFMQASRGDLRKILMTVFIKTLRECFQTPFHFEQHFFKTNAAFYIFSNAMTFLSTKCKI